MPSPGGLCAACAAADDAPTASAAAAAGETSAELAPVVLDPPTVTDPLGVDAVAGAPSVSFGLAADAGGVAPPLPPPPPGYELLSRLGGGGMGDVYLARDATSRRLVAMKFLRCPGDPVAFERFVRELRVLVALNPTLDHPNIVRQFANDFFCASPYFTMEYLEPGPLSRRLEGGAALDPAEAVRIVRAAAAALAAAHASNVVHRDVKPSNILMAADGTPKLADFGLVKLLDDGDPMTPPSGGLGTPSYMPPEQISRRYGAVGPWSDVYGLGATLYHLLTGRPPFVGDTPVEIIGRVMADAPTRPRALDRAIPLGLEAVALKCLEKRPRDRYPSMAELVADLDRYAAGAQRAPAMTVSRRVRRWAVRNRVKLAGSAAVAVGLVAAWLALAPPKSPEKVRAERRESISADLRAGRPVTLVGEEGEPLWWDSPTGLVGFGPNPTRTPDSPGGCYFPAHQTAIVRLLDPPIDRYRVELELQHVKGSTLRDRDTSPCLGFFFGYDGKARADGFAEFSLLSLGFNDFAVTTPRGADGESTLAVESYYCPLMPGQLVKTNRFPLGDLNWPLKAGSRFPGPWRGIAAEVSPSGVRLFWRPDRDTTDPPKPLVELTADDIRAYRAKHAGLVAVAGADSKQKFEASSDWSPRQGFGVWARGVEVGVRNVVVIPG